MNPYWQCGSGMEMAAVTEKNQGNRRYDGLIFTEQCISGSSMRRWHGILLSFHRAVKNSVPTPHRTFIFFKCLIFAITTAAPPPQYA